MAVSDRVSGSNRVESFSDGVFAIATTLLVLDLSVPEHADTFLVDLAAQWPSYLAFLAAFAILGLIWLSHHDLFSRLEGVNASLLLRNLLLLFLASLFSFPTAVLAASFRVGGTRTNQIAAIAIFDLTAVTITLAWAYLVRVPVVAPHIASALTRWPDTHIPKSSTRGSPARCSVSHSRSGSYRRSLPLC